MIFRKIRHALPLASLLVPVATDKVRAEDVSPIQLDLTYTGDVLSNVQGGLKRGTAYMDNLDVTLSIDGERALGWEGAQIFVYGLYNNGQPFSHVYAGDYQVVSNIETGVQAVRLYEAWIDQTFANDRASLRVGLYDLNSEFTAIEAAALFVNSSQGTGAELAQTGKNGPSIFPYTSLSARLEMKLADHLILRTAILDGVPDDPEHPKRTAINLGNGNGALVIGEIDYNLEKFRAVAGYWRYTARFPDQLTDIPQRGNQGAYGFVEGRFDRLSVFARAGWANAVINPVKYYFSTGAVYSIDPATRPDDHVGVAIAWAESGSTYRRLKDAEAREVVVELTYHSAITDFLSVQPDLQYVFNPNFDANVKNALVVGLRFELSFGYGFSH
ncbi:carbohydrate porin [Govanella unica]|uniref:Carbohydrate porin n=1 Tax=Govanella unica TaxID=2975056 RepID=A0A9X3TYE3_9PROT|nr:carbohydrate porin [Govania unica]MDA5193990.1 carbohydrate porin [Govania unica]